MLVPVDRKFCIGPLSRFICAIFLLNALFTTVGDGAAAQDGSLSNLMQKVNGLLRQNKFAEANALTRTILDRNEATHALSEPELGLGYFVLATAASERGQLDPAERFYLKSIKAFGAGWRVRIRQSDEGL